MNKEIKDFGEKVIQETYKKWMSYKNKYNIWKYGFGVFYSPVYYQPDLMIIGYNPGGTDSSFNLSDNLIIPEEHDYFNKVNSYMLAKKQIEIWENLKRIDLLKRSIKLNINFFGSKNIEEWKNVPKEIRKDLENFCISEIKEIIYNLEPKIILTEGIKTFDELLNRVFRINIIKTSFYEIRNKRMRIFTKYIFNRITILGIAHPSGCRLSNEDFNLIIDNLRSYFRE